MSSDSALGPVVAVFFFGEEGEDSCLDFLIIIIIDENTNIYLTQGLPFFTANRED